MTYAQVHYQPTSPSPKVRSTSVWICFLVAIVVSLAFSWHYLPFVSDDALIGYRYSDRLLHGHGLTWTDGEHVEGYSDLLWVLLVAAGGLIQSNLLLVGWVLGLLANLVTLIAIAWTFRRLNATSIVPLASGLFTLALSASFAIWGVGGLETALFAALLAWALGMCYRAHTVGWGWIYPAVLLGLLSITRPDGVLFGISIPFALLLRDGYRRPTIQHVLKLSLVPVAFMMAQITFRLAYYGSFVPNTAYVKIAFTTERLLLGGIYVIWGALANCVLIATIVISLVRLYKSQRWPAIREASVFLIPGLVWLCYVAAIGGDIWPASRHWIPALVCFAFASTSLLSAALPVLKFPRAALIIVAAVVLHFTLALTTVSINPKLEKGHLKIYSQSIVSMLSNDQLDCIRVGNLLRKAFATQRPLLAVDAAGCLPFSTGFPSLDMLGLNDFHIAHHRPPDMGTGSYPLAHELGDGPYVLSRKPDIIALPEIDGKLKPTYRSDIEIVGTNEFNRFYRPVHFDVSTLWIRTEEGRLGIVRTPGRIHIPGFLLATTRAAQTTLDTAGIPVTLLNDGYAEITHVDLPAGVWDISLMTDPLSHLQLAVLPSTGVTESRLGTSRLVSDGSARSFRVSGKHGSIYSIEATRVTALTSN